MAIVNNYTGFVLATQSDLEAKDLDPNFGENLNRSISKINQDYAVSAGIKNTYVEGFINQFGASSQFSTNEQRMVQNIIRESITINGITVRYMPRQSTYTDEVWNERPESVFDRGLQMDMMLIATSGFEGEGDVMTQYGIEFREEVILSIAIPRFESLYFSYESDLDTTSKQLYSRRRPLEGDLVVIPFGRSAANRNQYVPKVFEITRVTTYHDGAFFQLGDNYQYKIKARLFELSGEDLLFNPTVIQYNDDGTTEILADSETGRIGRTMDISDIIDSETGSINVPKDSDAITDSWGDNHEIEKRSQEVEIFDDEGNKLKEKAPQVVSDYTAKAFGYPSIINNLDDI